MTPFAATAGQHFTTVGGLHALAEPVNGFAAAAVRLERTFHVSLVFHCLKKGRENGRVSGQSTGHHTRGL